MAPYDIGPKIGIEGEKEFRNSIKAIDSQIRALGSELKTLSKEYDENDRSIDGVVKKQKTLNSAIDATENKIKLLTSQYEKQSAELRKLEDALEKARRENGEGSDEALKAEAALAKQATTVNRLENQLQTARGQLADFGNQLENLGNRATIAGDKLQSAGDKIAGIGSKISSAGNVLTGAVTAPLLAAGAAAISMASDYEESLNKVDVAFGESSDRIREFAKTTVDTYGIAEGTALDMAALFGDMATSMSVPRDEAAEMSEMLVGLAGDLASFKNISLEQVGTALKSIFTGETESLKELGVVMTEANLDAFALAEGFGKTTDEMTEAEKVQLRYQYVLNATRNAQGDYARTADGTANSLRTMQESAKELGVAFGQELLPTITPIIQGATKMIKSFGDLDDETKQTAISIAGVAAAAGPALKIVGTATTGIGKLTRGIGGAVSDIGKLVQSGGKATDTMGTFGKVLGTLGPKGMIIGGVVAGVAAIGTAVWKAHEDMVQADIESRFGDIALSAEEVEKIAERLTSTEWTLQVDTYINGKEDLDTAFQALEQAKSNLEKENWKVSLGLELAEEDIGSYTDAVKDYIESAIEAVEQASYTAQVSISAVFYPGSEAGAAVSSYSQSFYNTALAELQDFGDELSATVDEAFADGILTHDELINISAIQGRMQEMLDKVADRQYRVELKKLEISADKSGISEESFRELMDSAGEDLQTRIDSLTGITAEAVVNLEAMRDDRTITQKTYKEWEQQMQLYLAGNVAEFTLPAVELGVGTIETNYSDVITETRDNFQKSLNEAFEKIEAYPDGVYWLSTLWLELDQNFAIADEKARAGVESLVQYLEPQKESLEALREKYIAAGAVPPQAITEGLNDIYALEQMSGAADNALALLAYTIAESPERQNILAQSILAGQTIDADLAQALRDNYGLVWDATQGMFTTVQQASFLSQAEAIEFLNSTGVTVGSSLANSLSQQYELVYNSTTGLWEAVNAATANTSAGENVQMKGQGVGASAGTGYVEGASSQTGNVEAASSGLVISGEQALEGEQPNLEAQAKETGQAGGAAFAEGIDNTEPDVDSSAAAVATSATEEMQSTINGIVLNPPDMATPDWTSKAAAGRSGMQTYLNNNPLTVTVNQVVGRRVTGTAYALGGIVEEPQIALVGEAGAEAIIPLENNRARALDLFYQAGERLNAFAADQGRNVGEVKREQIVNNNTTTHKIEINNAEGAIVIQTKATDGKQLYKEFVVEMERDVRRKGVAYGKN